ncbi:dipeptidase 1 isoform X1 [Neodiprion pinetum]|uniref:dipeptidase 1 isoform X1 n=1 Tax=Neodiprion pinetum TaxID=441929 RepID=UPI001EDCDD0A|nr:dipeptidase 1-like isoform X1 [Neodiprion pinetum]
MPEYVNVLGLFHTTRKTLYVGGAAIVAILIVIIGLSVGLSNSSATPDTYSGSQALTTAPLIDGHNDLPYNLYALLNNKLSEFNFSANLENDSVWGTTACSSCFTDLPRLQTGKVGGQFWVAYTSCSSQYKDSVQLTLRQIDVIKRLINNYPENLTLVTNAADIETTWSSGKIASLIGVEGGHSMDSSLAILRLYYELGARYLTLTHSCNTPWADASPATGSPVYNLTEFGQTIVWEMNRLGMMVDLSHVSHNVMREVLAITKAPVIFSHSSAYALCDHYRNVPDDVLDLVKENDGIVMVNFYSGFVNCNDSRNATIDDVVDHINYIRNRIGATHVGIGADYDGVSSMPTGLEDVSKYPDLFDRLYNNLDDEPSWTNEDLENLAGRNLIRVFKAIEEVSTSLASELPYEDIIDIQELGNAQEAENLTAGACQTAIEWNDYEQSTTTVTTITTDAESTTTVNASAVSARR